MRPLLKATQPRARNLSRKGIVSCREEESRMHAERINRLGMEGAFAVLAKAQELEAGGKPVLHLEIGEPDFDTPANIREAAKRSLDNGETHYTPAPGLPELRKAAAEHVSATRGVPVSPEEVVIAPGVKPLVFLAVMSLVEEGDEVILPNPAYPTYESLVRFVKAVPVHVEMTESLDFRFAPDQLEKKISAKTKLIILNSPANPTGGVLTAGDMEKIAYLSQKHGITVLSDEIYSRLVYDAPFASYYASKAVKPRAVLLDGFSKAYAMTGWRLGFGVMPAPLAAAVTKLINNSHACTCTFVQRAGIEALKGPQDSVDSMAAEFKKRREVIVEGLNRIPGFRCGMPKGAFYVFPNIEGTNMESWELADFLLEKAGTAVLSGTAFGSRGEGHLRFSYANSVENIRKALARIQEALA